MNADQIKRIFIIIAYVCYVTLTILKNQLQLNAPAVEYTFVAVIGACLKLADSTNTIQQLLTAVDPEKLETLLQRTESILTGNVSERSLPYGGTPTNETHRDIVINDRYVLRVHQNSV